jgi:hypothetical protein
MTGHKTSSIAKISPAFKELSDEQWKPFEAIKARQHDEVNLLRQKQEKNLEELHFFPKRTLRLLAIIYNFMQ